MKYQQKGTEVILFPVQGENNELRGTREDSIDSLSPHRRLNLAAPFVNTQVIIDKSQLQ